VRPSASSANLQHHNLRFRVGLNQSGTIGSMARKRLMVVLGAVVIVAVLAVALVPLTHRFGIKTTDFVNFYAGASLVLHGHGARLYDRQSQDLVLESILGRRSTQYFLHPPFEAAALSPFALLSIEHGFVVWSLINVALLALLPLILMECLPLVAGKPYVALLGFCFLPVLTALTLGQDSIVLLFVISASYLLMCKKQDALAGFVLALAAIKFQYLLPLALLLAFARKWRVVLGLTIGGIVLVTISALVVGVRGIPAYLRFLHDFNSHLGYGSLNPTLMVNLRGFIAGVGGGLHGSGSASALAGGLLFLASGIAVARWAPGAQNHAVAFAIYITVALLAAPYAHFADATMLLLPILLVIDHLRAVGSGTAVRKLLWLSSVGLFVWPLVLLAVGGHYWWNSRIYLVFPLILFFLITLIAELYRMHSQVARERSKMKMAGQN